MLQSIIDRRLAGKNKSIGNRERFLRRYKTQIREAVKRAIDGRGIRDIERGEDIHIPKRDITEPVFGHGQGGVREVVHPGNKDFIRGDRIERPKGGMGGRQPPHGRRVRHADQQHTARHAAGFHPRRRWKQRGQLGAPPDGPRQPARQQHLRPHRALEGRRRRPRGAAGRR